MCRRLVQYSMQCSLEKDQGEKEERAVSKGQSEEEGKTKGEMGQWLLEEDEEGGIKMGLYREGEEQNVEISYMKSGNDRWKEKGKKDSMA